MVSGSHYCVKFTLGEMFPLGLIVAFIYTRKQVTSRIILMMPLVC